jgi:hypothetical protein
LCVRATVSVGEGEGEFDEFCSTSERPTKGRYFTEPPGGNDEAPHEVGRIAGYRREA